MNLELIFHNIGYTVGGILSLALGIFVYMRGRKQTANIMWMLGSVCVTIFCISHVIGVNTADPLLSRDILMFNMAGMFLTAFMAHCVFAVIGEAELKKQRIFLIATYAAAAVLAVIFIIFPDTFLLPSQPRLYFPDYYVAGSLQWLMRLIFNGIVPVYFIYRMILAYRVADAATKNRLKYFFTAFILGYGLGGLAVPLIFDIPVDPIWSAFFVPIYSIPIAYALIRYDLMDISVVAKRAATIALMIISATFGIYFIGYSNYLILNLDPQFPLWLLPLFGGILAALVGVLAWRYLRESEMLKYEFITLVTHKFRTPLTTIKWSTESLNGQVTDEGAQYLSHIKEGADRLIELTNVLADVSSENQQEYIYKFEPVDLAALCRDILAENKPAAMQDGINIVQEGLDAVQATVHADRAKLKVVLQTLIDNALTYTKAGGTVRISLTASGHMASVAVTDTGIGMTAEESRLIFSRFYRTDSARKSDTEGMGIGLFIINKIIERHGGHLRVHSDGPGKGSTFTLSLPLRSK